MRVCIVGRGKVGRALARELVDSGVEHALVSGRKLPRALPEADVYLFTVPDARVREVATTLASKLPRGACALHCAGARDVDELAACAQAGVYVGVFHPLVSFASPHAELSLRGATFTIFGDARATAQARRLAKLLGARAVVLPHAPGPAYHAAAALVANGAAALAYVGVAILRARGFERRAAERALGGLLASVAENVSRVGVPGALTGPVVRGDAATVARHLHALEQIDGKLLSAYRALQPAIIDTAVAAGLASALARKLRGLSRPSTRRRSTRSRTNPG